MEHKHSYRIESRESIVPNPHPGGLFGIWLNFRCRKCGETCTAKLDVLYPEMTRSV